MYYTIRILLLIINIFFVVVCCLYYEYSGMVIHIQNVQLNVIQPFRTKSRFKNTSFIIWVHGHIFFIIIFFYYVCQRKGVSCVSF